MEDIHPVQVQAAEALLQGTQGPAIAVVEDRADGRKAVGPDVLVTRRVGHDEPADLGGKDKGGAGGGIVARNGIGAGGGIGILDGGSIANSLRQRRTQPGFAYAATV